MIHATIVEYKLDDPMQTRIRRCPECRSVIGNKPAYWYLSRPLHVGDSREHLKAGFRTWYWTGDSWMCHGPKQFVSAEEAYEEWALRIGK